MTDHNEVACGPTLSDLTRLLAPMVRRNEDGYFVAPKDEALSDLLTLADSMERTIALLRYSQDLSPTEPTRAEDAPHVEPGGEREKLIAGLETAKDILGSDEQEDIDLAKGWIDDAIAALRTPVEPAPSRSSRDAVLEEAISLAEELAGRLDSHDRAITDADKRIAALKDSQS